MQKKRAKALIFYKKNLKISKYDVIPEFNIKDKI